MFIGALLRVSVQHAWMVIITPINVINKRLRNDDALKTYEVFLSLEIFNRGIKLFAGR